MKVNGIRYLEGKELKVLLKKMTKKTFKVDEYCKNTYDWWRLYSLCCMLGAIKDSRFTAITDREPTRYSDWGLRGHVFNHFFRDDEKAVASYYDLNRGRRQSLAYKTNRLSENLSSFVSKEIKDSSWGWYQKSSRRLALDIKRIYTVKCGYKPIGAVIANDTEHATQIANMVVKPLIPAGFIHDQHNGRGEEIEIVRTWEVWPERMMEDYVEETTRITGMIGEENLKHTSSIEKTQKKINDNQIIIDALRSNLMVTLDGNK